jgi:hypothetical protein
MKRNLHEPCHGKGCGRVVNEPRTKLEKEECYEKA